MENDSAVGRHSTARDGKVKNSITIRSDFIIRCCTCNKIGFILILSEGAVRLRPVSSEIKQELDPILRLLNLQLSRE
jgi:hypothetical protein